VSISRIGLVAALAAVFACSAAAAPTNWAAAQIQDVTSAGVLGTSPATFAPATALTQSALASAVKATDTIQHPPTPSTTPTPETVSILSTVGAGAIVGGQVPIEIQVSGRAVAQVAFALDGTGIGTATEAPYDLDLDTSQLAEGTHTLAVNVTFGSSGGYAIATWTVTVANAPGSEHTAPGTPVPLPIAKSWLPALPATPTVPVVPDIPKPALYKAASPAKAVTVKQLDAALVAYLGLGGAAREIQTALVQAGLSPPANTGTEAVARLLGLRLNHPASQDALELLPNQAATRAEAAYSFAQLLHLDQWAVASVQQQADTFTVPTLSEWQKRILTAAVHYVGYPYVWGGTSPSRETLFGVTSVGGFDCSGFVWRVYKLTSYPAEGRLASVLRGRTTYQMSGEVPKSKLISASKLQPADVMFFGANGPKSSPTVVDHAAIYLGNGWFVQSSDEGVTLLPFAGWYTRTFAWARRPLHEAGLAG
jgi:cell wall-associated NlpC family hydrolase